MGVLNRTRCVKLLILSVSVYYCTIIKYYFNKNSITKPTKGPSLVNAHLRNITYGEQIDWFKEETIVTRTANCDKYFQSVPAAFQDTQITKYEKIHLKSDVRLAFSHMLHNQVAIYEAFLAMYFRPYNYYCLHIDRKAEKIIRKAIEGLVKCYAAEVTTGKIFVIDKTESIEVLFFKTVL